MAKEELLEFNGTVTEVLPDGNYRVTLDNEHVILAYMSGKMRKFRIRTGVGDRVVVEVSPYDLTRGRITQIAETGDGRYLLQLTGIARFHVEEELAVSTLYRQCRVSYEPFVDDFTPRKGEDDVDRAGLLRALSDFLKANNLKADWEGIENAPNEALVNALAMMSPYGTAEKQALLEAPDLKTRAEILVAATEIELAKKTSGGETSLQ